MDLVSVAHQCAWIKEQSFWDKWKYLHCLDEVESMSEQVHLKMDPPISIIIQGDTTLSYILSKIKHLLWVKGF